ncbi:hypothetical protein [Amycolatopsis sp. CA-126428]|uniref:hypothetical protein n=1 Tax=Amycolatopsis sp. CA-126428 TaxID=2073158 RepID=UPI001E3F1470|nr:hypothetical protein [Amycolatopsis sp. CA-126428]
MNRIGAPCASVVKVPSGFDQVVEVSVRSDSTSTRDPCARADTAADTTSGRESTRTGATCGSAALATGSTTATAPNTRANAVVTDTIRAANDPGLGDKSNPEKDTDPTSMTQPASTPPKWAASPETGRSPINSNVCSTRRSGNSVILGCSVTAGKLPFE